MKYDADYFINKFSAILDEQWCIRDFDDGRGRHCALGHCGVPKTFSFFSFCGLAGVSPEGAALESLFKCAGIDCVGAVNNGRIAAYPQGTPKARILAALADVKAQLAPASSNSLQLAPIHSNSECCHIWLACGVCMICSATKPVEQKEALCAGE
jgi:hypothetical protein